MAVTSTRLLLLALTHGFAASTPDVIESGGDPHWSIIDNQEYFVYNGTRKKNYAQATKHCEDLGAHLVVVATDESHDIVVRLIKESVWNQAGKPYRSFFIGLHDYTGNNANYVWANGEMLHFIDGTPMHWADGEPNNFNGVDEDCVTMGSSALTANYDWFDVPCSVKRSYVCQRYTADAIYTPEPLVYIFNSGMVFFVFAIMFLTGLYHKRKIFKVKLVASTDMPPAAEDGDARPEVMKLGTDDEVQSDEKTSTAKM